MMKGTIRNHHWIKRNKKRWCALGILTLAIAVGLMDAATGLHDIAAHRTLEAGNVIDIADVIAGTAAAWMLRS